MEISNPGSDPSSVWYVTNGLLVVELTTGRLQLGDAGFSQRQPAAIDLAGDAGDGAVGEATTVGDLDAFVYDNQMGAIDSDSPTTALGVEAS